MRTILLFCLATSGLPAQQAAPDALQDVYHLGEAALAEGRYADAEKAYEKLRELSPTTAEVYAKLGVIYFQQGKFEQAVPVLRQGLKLKPGLPRADVLLAMSLSELGQFNEALPGLQKGFKSPDPELKRMSGLQLERAYTGLGQDEKAVEVALQLTKLYPKDPEVLYQSSRLFGNYAYVTLRQLNQAAPNSPWRHLASGEALESQHDYDAALTAYRQVLALTPGKPGVHFRIGRVLLAKSPDAEARAGAAKAFEKELELDPSNANAAYELGEIRRKAGELEPARQLFELALKHYPDFEEAQVALGRTLMDLGKADVALPHFEKAVALDPDDAVAHFQLARAYGALGKASEQEQAAGRYRRLREKELREQEARSNAASAPRDVTKQELDPQAAK